MSTVCAARAGSSRPTGAMRRGSSGVFTASRSPESETMAGLGNLPHPVHAQAHTQRLGTRIGDVEHDAPRLAAAGCRHVEHPVGALDPAANRQGTVVCRSHLLRIIGGHPPHLGRGEENLPLIPAVVVLPVGLQGIGRAEVSTKSPMRRTAF